MTKITTEEFINSMKDTTFGAEVEMNNITRGQAARTIAKLFGTNNFYHKGTYYDVWTAVDEKGREWDFSHDCSISGPSTHRCEMITPVLKYEDMETLQSVIRALRKEGAKSSPSRGCGVHIHIGGDGHTPKTIKNLCNLMARYEKELAKMINIAPDRMSSYCQLINRRFLNTLNAEKPKTMEELAEVWYTTQGSYVNSNHYDGTRYHMLNLHAFFNRYHTVEFRMFQFDEETAERRGGLHAGQLKAMIQLCLAMNQLAKVSKDIGWELSVSMSERRSMNILFGKLRFKGEEFATARKYFRRNIERNGIVQATVQRTEAVQANV